MIFLFLVELCSSHGYLNNYFLTAQTVLSLIIRSKHLQLSQLNATLVAIHLTNPPKVLKNKAECSLEPMQNTPLGTKNIIADSNPLNKGI